MKPYVMIIILVVVLAIAVFVWYNAIKASQKSGKIRRQMMAKLDRFNALSAKYATLIKDELEGIDNADLFDVAIIRIWKKLGSAEEELENFKALSADEKSIYTTWYIREEIINDGFSSYFRNCGTALGDISVDALRALDLSALADIMERACVMFDAESEVSCDKNDIAAIDAEFKLAYNPDEYSAAAAAFIRSHCDAFVDSASELVEIGEAEAENE